MSGRKEYARAPEVAEVAARLIELYHPHLDGVRIEYVWVNKPPVIGGQKKAAVMRKVSGLHAFLATPGAEGEPKPFFVMEVCLPVWLSKSAEWRLALVDHELKHGGRKGETDALFIVPHDFEDFHDVAERHGAWNEDLELLSEALSRADGRVTATAIAQVNYGPGRQAEESLARIDLRRSQDPRDQQTRFSVRPALQGQPPAS
ncbi:MAG TPA: putative metallopeptidase [Pyrinomonadaceae bacterium]|nr:putative metallopeptidase [Pyrinomonadaceae bacterium]